MTDRPKWPFVLTEAEVRKLAQPIAAVRHHWEQTGADTVESWIELHPYVKDPKNPHGPQVEGPGFRPRDGWWDFFRFSQGDRSLLCATSAGLNAITRLREIDAWEKVNAAERAEYERLKAKFEGGAA